MRRSASLCIVWSLILGSPLLAADAGEALWSAARKGDAKAVEALLAKGADVNAKTSYGATALWLAAYKGRLDAARVLLKHKADINVRDGIWGLTPLGMAVDGGHAELVKLLLQAGAKGADAGLMSAAQQGRVQLVQAILDNGKLHSEALDAALALTPAKQTKIADMLKKAGAKPLAKAATKAEKEALAACAGTYEDTRGVRSFLFVQEGMLLAVSITGDRWVLKPAGGNTFHALGQDGVRLIFARAGVKATQFTLKRPGGDTVFTRVEEGEAGQVKVAKYEDTPVAVTAPGNWPSFRGPHASGVADGQGPPVAWDVATGHNLRWKTPIPGFGHSCPIVWGDRIFVTTAVSGDRKATFRRGLYGDVDSVNDTTTHTWSVYCLDKHSGKILWERVAHRGVPRVKRHLKASHANCTPATDGRHVVACFGSEGLYCYDLDGNPLWKRDLGFLDASFFLDPDYQWGFGSSPIIYRNLVILQCDVGKGSFIAAYDLDSGRPVWTTPRDEIPSWGTPTVYEGPPRDELVTNATNSARGYDPRTGKELWHLAGNAEITVPTPVVGHGLIFVTSGYRPIQPIYAIRPGASGNISLAAGKESNAAIAWSKRRGGPYLPTPIVYGDYLYTCSNNGIVACYTAATGKQVYQQRLGGSAYTASPVAADGKLYFTSEEGDVRVVRAGPRFELLAVNKTGDPSLTTPAIADGMIFVRTQHYLFGIGRTAANVDKTASDRVAGTVAPAQPEHDDRLQLMDVFKIEYASDPQVSPDGKRVAYVRNFLDVMKDRPRSHVWMIGVDGSDHRPVTGGDANESSPRWSPDGKRLLYISDAGGSGQLHCQWMDTGQSAQLTRLPSAPVAPAWSPDGKSIAFGMFVEEKEKPFVELPAPPEGAEWAKPPRVIRKLVYRFDGKGYLKNGHYHVFLLPADGGTPRRLTHGPYDHLQTIPFLPPKPPSWTPDGKAIVLSANRHPDAEYDLFNSDVYEVSVRDGTVKALTDRNGPDENPVVSPDGKLIAYYGYDNKHLFYQAMRLAVMHRDGTGKRLLTETLDREPQNLVWGKDGSGLYVQYVDRGNTKIGFIDLRGNVRPLAEGVGGTDISRPYSSGSFSVGGDGVLAFTLTSPGRPADVAVRTPNDDKPRRLTTLNDSWLAERTLGAVEEIWYPSSHDRREIQGWIVKPPHFDPKKKYPLILEIHGGPQADYGAYFTAEIQLYAAAGYVVLYTNPRGSTGYGEAFTQLINDDYPGHDYDDLMSGVDAVLKRGYVDRDNLFVTGGSGGGILTAWIVGKTKRFRAAVAAKPVINWYSEALTEDAYPLDIGYAFRRPPWETPEPYLKHSPISLVGNVTTPTMLLTGEQDHRTPITEAEQFYQALKLRKVDTALVRIPEASHAMVDRPSRLMAKVAHILKWFEMHRAVSPSHAGAVPTPPAGHAAVPPPVPPSP